MKLSGEFFFVVVWHLVLISQWGMKSFEQKFYGGAKPLNSFNFKKFISFKNYLYRVEATKRIDLQNLLCFKLITPLITRKKLSTIKKKTE